MPRRRGQEGVLLGLAAMLIAVGCGADDEAAGPASLAPPDAPLFAEIEIDGEGDQTEALSALLERVADIEDPQTLVIEEVDAALAPGDLSYSDDVEPWLGSRAALFVRSFEPSRLPGGTADMAVFIEAEDPDAAQEFVETASEQAGGAARSHGETDYTLVEDNGRVAAGIVGDYLVVGTEAAFKVAADAHSGESLAESDEYEERVAELNPERIGAIFVEPGAALEAALTAEGVDGSVRRTLAPLLAGVLGEPMAGGISFADEGASLEVVAGYSPQEDRELAVDLAALPAGSWVAATARDLGPSLSRLLDVIERGGLPGARSLAREVRARTGIEPRRDVLSWLGGAAGFVEGFGAPGLSVGVIAQTTDVEGPRRALAVIEHLIERELGARSSGPPEDTSYGFTLGFPALGGGIEGGVRGDQAVLVAGTTIDGAVEPESTLGDDERFRRAAEALGDEFEPNAFLHLPTFLMAAAAGDPSDPDYPAAEPYVERLDSILGGVRFEGDQVVSRWVLTLADE